MKKKGFRDLVSEGLGEKVKYQSTGKRPRNYLRQDIMMLQLAACAATGDSPAIRRVLKLLKENMPAPQQCRVHVYELDSDWNVIDPDGKILGPLSDFPDLPTVSGPIDVPKEWLTPRRRRKGRKKSGETRTRQQKAR